MTKDRKGFIGASEVSSLLNLNPFCSPLQLWALKTGKITQEEEPTEYQEWGNRLEKMVSKKFADDHKVKLIAYKKRFVHKLMPYFSCELDNIIAGTDEIVEIKTVNAFKWKQWEKPNELPDYVIIQVMTQMGLTGRKKAWVACLCGGQKYIEKEVLFDEDVWHKIEANVREFWERFILTDTPPMATGIDNPFIIELNPKHDDKVKEADDEMNTKIGLLQEVKFHIDELFKTKDEVEAQIKQVIGNSLGIKTSQYQVTWKEQPRTSLDTEKIKEDGLYDKYKVISSTRVLRVRKDEDTNKTNFVKIKDVLIHSI